ncbi:unnamed protein product, partial [Gulo gulo]
MNMHCPLKPRSPRGSELASQSVSLAHSGTSYKSQSSPVEQIIQKENLRPTLLCHTIHAPANINLGLICTPASLHWDMKIALGKPGTSIFPSVPFPSWGALLSSAPQTTSQQPRLQEVRGGGPHTRPRVR